MNSSLHLPQRQRASQPGLETTLSRLLHERTLWVGDPDARHGDVNPHYTLSPSSSPSAIPFHLAEIDSVLPHGGLQNNSSHEILYDDPLQPKAVAHTLPALIAHNAYAQWRMLTTNSTWNTATPLCPSILWIGKRCWPTPLSLSALYYSDAQHASTFLQHSLFIDPPNDTTTLWAIETALRSRAVQLVIATCPRISRTTTQKLALAARTHHSTAILLRSHRDLSLPSCATSRWQLRPTPSSDHTPSWELQLLKLKGGTPPNASWIIGIHDSSPSNTETGHPLFAKRQLAITETDTLPIRKLGAASS
jgi:hypothetical protein